MSLKVNGLTFAATGVVPASATLARARHGRRLRCNPTAAATSHTFGPEQPLREWLAREGGFLHPGLRLVDRAPCGCRGVVAAEAIPLEELAGHGPLVVVPKDLHLENTAALKLLESWMGPAAAADAAAGMSSAALVAVALAYEKALGAASRWAPYIASLPEEPPAPWLLPREALAAAAAAAIAGRGGGGGEGGCTESEWVAAAKARRSEVEEEVTRACLALADAAAAADAARHLGSRTAGSTSGSGGDTCGSWLTPPLLTWALAHVQSRSLGTAGSSGLVPVVDLLNHCASARPPMLQLDDSDRLVVTALPTRGGEAAPLAAGEELLISYGARAPLEGWLKFGFVADEWWEGAGDEEV